MKKLTIITLLFFVIITFAITSAYAQTPPPGQTGGGIMKSEEQIAQDQELQKKLRKKKAAGEKEAVKKEVPLGEETKTLIKTIEVRDVTLVKKEAIDKIVRVHEGKELTLKDMQGVCDEITAEYRKAGYLTSRAYLPPQTIRDGALVIMVIEGKLGNVEVKGNRYFSSKLLKKKLGLKPGEYFDYKTLQRDLVKINEHPDRFVKSMLVPGKDPGTTDIVLEVEDKLPVHEGYTYDNFGSRYINYDRHSVTAEHNNLFGLDDKLYFLFQKGQNIFYEMYNFRYTIPLTNALEGGIYYLWSNTKLGKEFKDIGVKGESQLGGLFFNYTIIDLDTVDMRFMFGLDYKHVANFISGLKTSRDESRVIKVGFDLDLYDRWGRTIINFENDTSVPIGNLHAKDPIATRQGAGSEFNKFVGTVYRLQPMPFESYLLWKNQFQLTGHTLGAVEQFQLGGISNVRGYEPAEYTGDAGWATSFELSVPPYGFPKNVKVPLSKSTVYEATRFVGFYDLGIVRFRNDLGTDKKQRAIQGYGVGLRFNLPEDFSARLETAWRISSKASFSDAKGYMTIAKKF